MYPEIYIDYAIRLLEAAKKVKKAQKRKKKKMIELYENEEGFFTKASNFFKGIWEKIKSFLRSVKNGIKSLWNKILNRSDVKEEVGGSIEPKELERRLEQTGNDTLKKVKNEIPLQTQTGSEDNVEQLKNQIERLSKEVEKYKNVVEKIKELLNKIIRIIADCDANICNLAKGFLGEAYKAISSLNETKNLLFEGFFDKVRSGLRTVWNYAKEYFKFYLLMVAYMFIMFLGYELAKLSLFHSDRIPPEHNSFFGILKYGIQQNLKAPAVIAVFSALFSVVILVVSRIVKRFLRSRNSEESNVNINTSDVNVANYLKFI